MNRLYSVGLSGLAFLSISAVFVVAISWAHHPEGIIKALKGAKKREHEKDC